MTYVADRSIAFDIDERLQDALNQARSACTLDFNSPACATAWDVVEEIQADIAHKRQGAHKNSLESYCDANPDADECRVYDV
ncbi:MAG: Calvin cycle protein CP12 [Cyanobacteria bacterium P01_E01_bin.6]